MNDIKEHSKNVDILFDDEVISWRKLPPDSPVPVDVYIHSLEILRAKIQALTPPTPDTVVSK